MLQSTLSPVWIFGYGSLIWRTDIPYVEKQPARVIGFERRFWQASTDHRGIPGAPGRVLTLVPTPGAQCVGMIFRLPSGEEEAILRHLDHREKNGYERQPIEVELTAEGEEIINAITYLAPPHNPHFLGDAPLSDMASQIIDAHGPSGSNLAYLLELEKELVAHGIRDSHIETLALAVRKLQSQCGHPFRESR